MPDYLPHTEPSVASMLGFLGLSSLDELFAAVPAALRLAGGLDLADGACPSPTSSRPPGGAGGPPTGPRGRDLVCFAGGGAYDHEVPPVVRALAGRSEFVTSYTPYQPEVAQGVLQAVFEFQTLVARLSGLPVANASLYDGASALVEAVNLGVAATGRPTVWVSAGVNPHWRSVLATFAAGTGHRVGRRPAARRARRTGPTRRTATTTVPGVVVVAYPNYLGCLEDLAEAGRRSCDRHGALLVVASDPVLRRDPALARATGGPTWWWGRARPSACRSSFGGPYLGLFACTLDHVRRLPGRLVGETVDAEGRRAYVTTLRAREQDIRREKATSNVCTNQTLMAVTAAIQLGWLGHVGAGRGGAALRPRGHGTAATALLALDGVEPLTAARRSCASSPCGRRSRRAPCVERLADEGFLAGLALDALDPEGDGVVSPDDAGRLVVAVTERRTRTEIDAFVAAFDKAVR